MNGWVAGGNGGTSDGYDGPVILKPFAARESVCTFAHALAAQPPCCANMDSRDEPSWARGPTLGRIDGGSYGQVFMSMDTITGQAVAIKVQSLPSESAAREFACLSLLKSFPCAHIMVMIDHWVRVNENGTQLCTVYPLADTCLWRVYQSEDVQQQIFPDALVAQYLAGVAKGLSHMHRLRVVHGDAPLKNMLLCRGGIVQVADVGTSHSAHSVLGLEELTTHYVNAPERWLGQPDIAPPVDIWAWGVMCYMLGNGRCGWLGHDSVEDVFPSLETVVGPIDETSWPGHSAMPKWRTHFADERPRAEGGEAGPGRTVRFGSSFLAALRWSPLRRSWDAVFDCDLLQAFYPGLTRPSLVADSGDALVPQKRGPAALEEDATLLGASEPKVRGQRH